MTKIMLINPPSIKVKGQRGRGQTPTGLLSIAGYLRERGIDVSLLDATMEGFDNERPSGMNIKYGLNKESIAAKIRESKPDWIGVSGIFSSNARQSLEILRLAKEIDPDVRTITGGHHASFTEYFQDIADHVIIGEGEIAAYKIITGETEDKIVREGRVSSLDELADPAWDMMKMDLYRRDGIAPYPNQRQNPFIHLLVSRGCPRACHYCTSTAMHGGKLRTFSPARIRKQVETITNLGWKEVVVMDDEVATMKLDTRNALFGSLKESGLSWLIDGGLYYPQVDETLVQSLAENDCYQVFLSFENPDLQIMHSMGKYREMNDQSEVYEQVRHVSRLLNQYGIKFYSAVMTGFPEQTRQAIENDLSFAEFIKEEGADKVYVFPVIPFPGTAMQRRFGGASENHLMAGRPAYDGRDYSKNWLEQKIAETHLQINNALDPSPGEARR